MSIRPTEYKDRSSEQRTDQPVASNRPKSSIRRGTIVAYGLGGRVSSLPPAVRHKLDEQRLWFLVHSSEGGRKPRPPSPQKGVEFPPLFTADKPSSHLIWNQLTDSDSVWVPSAVGPDGSDLMGQAVKYVEASEAWFQKPVQPQPHEMRSPLAGRVERAFSSDASVRSVFPNRQLGMILEAEVGKPCVVLWNSASCHASEGKD